MANANRELMMAKIKGLSITLIQSPSAAATVVILIISLGFLSLVAGEFETFLPIGAISIFVFLFLLTFKSDTLRDNKYLIANKRLELEQEKDKPLMETIEGEIVQPILEQPKKELKKKRK